MNTNEHVKQDGQDTVVPASPEVEAEAMINRNVAQLNAALLGKWSEDFPQMDDDGSGGWSYKHRNGVQLGEGMYVYKGDRRLLDRSLKLIYNTRTGQFGFPDSEYQFGDYCQLHTFVRSSANAEGPFTIQLLNPADVPTVEQLHAAITGSEPVERQITIQPQVVIPEYPQLVGVVREFGQDSLNLGIDPAGDAIVIESLRRFNNSQVDPSTN